VSADLVTWLRGCLDDDQRSAEACINEVGAHRAGEMYSDGSGTADYDAFPSYPWGSDAAELAYMAGPGHPARVLAEVTAKRELLQLHRPVKFTDVSLGIDDAVVCFICHVHLDEPANWDADVEWAYPLVQESWPCQTAAALAQVYRDRPGFDPSWLD
jgi:hypothetical protein